MLLLCVHPEKLALCHGAGVSVRELARCVSMQNPFRGPQQEPAQQAWGVILVRLAGSCGFVCQSSYSCVADGAAEDEESAVAEE